MDERKKQLDDLDAEEKKINAAINDTKKKTLDANSVQQLAELDQAKTAVRQAALGKVMLIDRQAEATRLEQRLDHEQAATDLQAEALKSQGEHLTAIAGLVNTAVERNRLEQEAMTKQQEADRIATAATLSRAEEELAAAKLIPKNQEAIRKAQEKVDAAQQAINEQGTKQADTRNTLAKAQEGPIQKYSDSLADLNDTMAQAGVDAAKALSDGLADAIVNAKSLGDVAANVFRQLVAQVSSALIQKNLADPILKIITGGFAGGTNYAPGGLALVGEKGPELVNLPAGAQVIPNSALRSVGIGGGQVVSPTFVFDNRGAVIWEQAARQMMTYADRAAMGAGSMAVAVSRRSTPSDLARSGSRRLS